MKCPTCKDISLVMSERQSIEIDYCPECRGVWLDNGELDKIIERSSIESSAHSDRKFYEKKYKSDKYEHYDPSHRREKRKKKNFFSELFDF